VLHEQHGEVERVAQFDDRLAERLGLAVAEAARRLVEHQQLGVREQRSGELDPLERAVGQSGDRPVRVLAEVEPLEQVEGLPAQRALAPVQAGQTQDPGHEAGSAALVRAEQHVLADRHRGEQAEVLERARDTQLGDPMRLAREHVLAVEPDRAGLRRVQPADAVEERRLARAVRPDEPADLTAFDIERRLVQRCDASELNSETVDLQQCHSGSSSQWRTYPPLCDASHSYGE
jgi:hypothetical protein